VTASTFGEFFHMMILIISWTREPFYTHRRLKRALTWMMGTEMVVSIHRLPNPEPKPKRMHEIVQHSPNVRWLG
jgi:hypothetical protein